MTSLPALSKGKSAAGKPLHLVGFRVGNEEYCFEILKVQEIIRMAPITAVPNAPGHVEGIINLRGRIVPVIDFRRRFHITAECTVDEADKVIVITATRNATVGFIVDALSQVMKLPAEDLSPAPAGAAGYDGEAIRGVGNMGDRLVIVLDLDRMFSDDELSGLAGTTASRP
ncbi:chemotaxis protein CheW [Geobacter hydrogenophilus]|uniref:Chemotaxis protein CheW n=1 Tax=Geobacter hydrogenophilus TaxID=40983 RepID=A0A9W6FZS2_9BACT|nr:chemotaxis protein CheW [Geobacter hydrogenophilus]MBT0893496.1 chemotaxis protein CheW [Geobacter hydrogenophilus]GLI37809.1 chemotaxis protein CheW [Geobacter hydrogenophilus]